MATIQAVFDNVTALNVNLSDIKTKLDGIKDFVASLQASAVSQEQIDQLAGLVDSANQTATGIITEESEIKPA